MFLLLRFLLYRYFVSKFQPNAHYDTNLYLMALHIQVN